jgi:putative ABC transport system substrate-binding protein
VDRRVFLGTLAGGLLTAPLAAEAQPAKVPRIGYLAVDLAANPQLPEAFRQGLRDLGYVEGRNVVIEYRGLPQRQGPHRRQTLPDKTLRV